MKFAMNAPVLIQVVTLRCAYNVTKAIPQGEVSATAKAIVKEVAFNRWTNYARAKDVTEFNAAEKANVILRVDLQSGIKIPIGYVVNAVVTGKRSGVRRGFDRHSLPCRSRRRNRVHTLAAAAAARPACRLPFRLATERRRIRSVLQLREDNFFIAIG